MKNVLDKRRHVRYKLPIFTLLPEITDDLLELQDIGTGGFKVVISKRADTGSPIQGTLHRSGKLIARFLAHVAWGIKNSSEPQSWTIGVSMDVHGGDKSRLNDELQAGINMVG